MKFVGLLLLVLLASSGVMADIYMHNMRGSNNRLNEATATRTNANRLFDSQNNDRGGYNVGDRTNAAFNGGNPTLTPDATYDPANQNAAQYPMVFYEGSVLTFQWTSQHGCGGNDATDPHNTNCNMVLQYTCDTNDSVTDEELRVTLADGGNTNAPDATATYANIAATRNNNNANQRGRHESEGYYYVCQNRNRNKGLFIADQNLNNRNKAINTRQNPNGGRSGLECPEERDYYPYWRPTPWRDIAYLHGSEGDTNVAMCNLVQTQSNNVFAHGRCMPLSNAAAVAAGTYEECMAAKANDGTITWETYHHDLPAPDCRQAQWSRDNHLGDTRDGTPLNYTWTLPAFSQLSRAGSTGFKTYGTNNDMVKCVARLRYNISTDDYDPWNTDAKFNEVKSNDPTKRVVSPVTNNPTVDIGADLQGLQLALNTAQTGRTFQDRSHIFYIKRRPAGIGSGTIYNLNVRGKRGNIVQTFPAVEYDFVPNSLSIGTGDLIHVQWTGSNTHNNGGGGGDGQAGDDGQGTGGTDRSNMALTKHEGEAYPIPLDTMWSDAANMWRNTRCWDVNGAEIGAVGDLNCPITLATSGLYRTKAAAEANANNFNALLNNAPASLIGGVVLRVNAAGTYTYICTRNNNFTNRSQKGCIIVT